MSINEAQESDSIINLREISLRTTHEYTLSRINSIDTSGNNLDTSDNRSISTMSDENIFEQSDSISSSSNSSSVQAITRRISSSYDTHGKDMYNIKISPKVIDSNLLPRSFASPISQVPLDVFNNTNDLSLKSTLNSTLTMPAEIGDDIYKIIHIPMNKTFTEDLLNKCGLYNTDPTLKSMVDNLIRFVRTSFGEYSSYSNDKLIAKYKNKIATIVSDINRLVNILVINGQDQKLDDIIILYNETKSLLVKISLKEDNTYDYLIEKIINVILINQNIIIITSLWRKSLDINTIIQSGIEIFHNLLDTVILPLKSDLSDAGMNAMSYEPRILTECAYSMTPIHSTASSPVRYSNNSNTDIPSNSIRANTIRRSGSNEHTPISSRRHDTDEEHYIGDFTSKKPMSFDQLNAAINASYGNTDTLESSTAIDIVSVYLRGQKILYTEGKNYCERYLNMLMIPAIIVVSVAGLMTQVWLTPIGRLVVSILMAINILLLTVISYLKLDAKAEAHKTSATNYGLLEMKCQFLSGKIMYMDVDVKLNAIIDEIEKKVIETKTANQFVLPDHVIAAYPEIYNTNVFAKVKLMFIKEIVMRNNLKNTVNKLHFMSRIPNKTPEIREKLVELESLQDAQLNDIIEYKKNYLLLDKPFVKEIQRNVVLKKARWYCCFGIFNKLTCGFCYKVFFWVSDVRAHHKQSLMGDSSNISSETTTEQVDRTYRMNNMDRTSRMDLSSNIV